MPRSWRAVQSVAKAYWPTISQALNPANAIARRGHTAPRHAGMPRVVARTSATNASGRLNSPIATAA